MVSLPSLKRTKGGLRKQVTKKISIIQPLKDIYLKRLKKEADIDEGNNKYRDLVELAHEGLAMVDSEDNLTFVNKQFAKSLGYKVHELIGVSLFDLADKKTALKIKKQMTKRKKGIKSRYEVILFHKDRTLKCFLLSATPRFGPNGEFLGSMAVYADMTEKKAMERRLEKKVKQINSLYRVYSHARVALPLSRVFHGIAESITQAMPITEHSQAKIIFDDKVYSYPKKHGRFVTKVQIPLFVKGVKRGILEVGYTRKIYRLEMAGALREEHELAENIAKILGKHMYAREMVDRNKSIVNRAFTGIAIVQNDRIRYANPRFCKMLKYKEAEIINKPLNKFLPFCKSDNIEADGKVKECTAIQSDECVIDIVITRLATTHHGKSALLVKVSDTTDLKLAQGKLKNFNKELKAQVREKTKNLRTANKRLQAMNVIKDEFVAITSHELRSPLTSIRGYLSFLMEEEILDKLGDPYRDYLLKAYSTTDSINYLINNILDASRLDMGRFNLQIQKIDIVSIIQSVCDTLQYQAGEKKLELAFENSTDISKLYASLDAVRMTQVLRNIIDNSIKFTRRGKKITVDLQQTGATVTITIADQGIGIPKEKLSRIFEKFTQIKKFNTRNQRGVGLGLFITKRIVELHGGEIKADKNKFGGTIITITLPINASS